MEAQFLDVPGNGRLSSGEALLLQRGQKLLLGGDLLVLDDPENGKLPTAFHVLSLPASRIFLQKMD